MKFKFDANQEYQLDAVNAVVGLFEGQDKTASTRLADDSNLFGIYPNTLSLAPEEVQENLTKIREHNGITNGDATEEMDFSVEMETGTGKTYVYLRTIFELNKQYNWKKFIILVPSVAIREGVIKSLQITQRHFADLYDNVPFRFFEYQSKNISRVKHFADSNTINIMVMTVASFNSDKNVLYSSRDQMHSEQPISYIQKTNPILILDEPQNMEGEATKESLKNFNSLIRLRYSATHKNAYNLVYQLTPYDAYQLGLVKKIEVYSVTDDDSGISRPFLNLLAVRPGRTIKATIEVIVKDDQGDAKKKKLSVGDGDDIAEKTNNEIYDGYLVDGMQARVDGFVDKAHIHFSNGIEIAEGEGVGGSREDVMRQQIRTTIQLHFEKRAQLRGLGIKPLSLFFIDKVSSYVAEDGFIQNVFLEELHQIITTLGLEKLKVDRMHKGYFAMRGERYIEQENAMEKNNEAFQLIMRDKERLLSMDEPTEFIFSHSALKEGWDNPNIFNICTLRETITQTRKRQEIGRGMRLCVNQSGERVFQRNLNLLSVVANESYAEYVGQLQSEMAQDGIYKAPPAPHNAKRKKLIKLKKDFQKNEDFAQIWEQISKRTRYFVDIESQDLIDICAKRLANLRVQKPRTQVTRAGVTISSDSVTAGVIGTRSENITQVRRTIDVVETLKNETKLTRKTIAEILIKADNAKMFITNPERFCFEASRIIKAELTKKFVEQVSYEVVPESYSVKQFENISGYKDSIQSVSKSIYDAIVYDSEVEQKFALKLNDDERIKLFIKLPNWFKVDTPVGSYNPDWAIVTTKRDLQGNESDEKIYFVIETKGNLNNLRKVEQEKITSAKKHFEVISVNYKEVQNFDQFVSEFE